MMNSKAEEAKGTTLAGLVHLGLNTLGPCTADELYKFLLEACTEPSDPPIVRSRVSRELRALVIRRAAIAELGRHHVARYHLRVAK